MTPSATVADSKLSMAPKIAMVSAGDTSLLMVSHVISGTCASGSSPEMEKRSPIVSMLLMPAKFFNRSATTVMRIIATSEPGIFLLNFGVMAITTTLRMPMRVVIRSAVLQFWI